MRLWGGGRVNMTPAHQDARRRQSSSVTPPPPPPPRGGRVGASPPPSCRQAGSGPLPATSAIISPPSLSLSLLLPSPPPHPPYPDNPALPRLPDEVVWPWPGSNLYPPPHHLLTPLPRRLICTLREVERLDGRPPPSPLASSPELQRHLERPTASAVTVKTLPTITTAPTFGSRRGKESGRTFIPAPTSYRERQGAPGRTDSTTVNKLVLSGKRSLVSGFSPGKFRTSENEGL